MLGYFHTPPGTPDVPLNGPRGTGRDLMFNRCLSPWLGSLGASWAR
jgi:hypothetical protein